MSLYLATADQCTSARAEVAERILDEDALRRWPLPKPDDKCDKGARGKVVIVAGSREMPGAAVLAATAALRAGASKLIVVTAASIAGLVAAAVPEARVLAMAETATGASMPARRKGLPH